MFSWVPLLALLPSILAGWRLSGLSFQDKGYRLLATPFVALSLATSVFFLLDSVLSPVANSLLCASFSLAIWVFLGRLKGAEKASYPTLSKGQLGLIALLALSAWFYSQGHLQLFPDINFLLWELNQTSPGTRTALLAAASFFAKDPWLGTLLFVGLSQVSLVLGAFALARLCLKTGSKGWVLTGLFLLGCTEQAWLVFQSPAEVPNHLWALSALFLIAMEKRYPLYLALLILTALSWSKALLGLAILLIIPRWNKSLLTLLTILGLILSLYFKGFSVGLTFAAGFLLYHWKSPKSLQPWTIRFALLELLSPVSGLFGLTAFAVQGGKKLEEEWLDSEPGKLQRTGREIHLPKRAVIIAVALVVFWNGIDGAETVFNDSILIGSQREQVSLLRLARPCSLQTWLSWRGAAYGFSGADHEAIEAIKSLPGQNVYLSGPLPDPRVSSLLAVASGKAFLGWTQSAQGPRLDRALALYLATEAESALAGYQADFLLRPGQKAIPLPEAAEDPWQTTEGPLVQLDGPKGQPVSMESLLVGKVAESQAREVPAASLLPIELIIKNPTPLELDLSKFRGIRFHPSYPNRKPLAPIDNPTAAVQLGTLSPGQTWRTTAYLRTDNFPLDYDLKVSLSKEDGTFQPIGLEESVVLKSYRPELPLDLPPEVKP